jgi:hypothetical protein
MESMVTLRKAEFENANAKPIIVNDSRFGIRKFFINENERPSIGGVYAIPGKGPNGESQN